MSLYRFFKLLCLPLAIGLILSGCRNSTNLKDIIIVEGMAIDEAENDDIKLTVQMLNVAKSASNGEAPSGNMTENISTKGATIVDSMSAMTKKLSKDLFFGQTKIVAFGRELAEKGIEKHLDYFLRSTDTRSDVAICMAEESASKLLESAENDSRVPSENILYLLQNGESAGVSAYITTGQAINLYEDKTSDIYMPVLVADEKDKNVRAGGIAVFNGDKVAAILDDDETMGFLLINGKVRGFVMEFEDDKLGKVGVELMNIKSKNHAAAEASQLVFHIDISADMIVNEIEKSSSKSLSSEDTERLCREAEAAVERKCNSAFYACVDAESDSIRLGEYTARDLPEAYEKCSDSWKVYFTSSSVNSNVKIKLKKIVESIRS